MITPKSKNYKLVSEFYDFCTDHPELRFWQALRAWMKVPFILTSTHFQTEMFNKEWLKENKVKIQDTFYREGKDKLKE